jgi:hypothetical protein
MVSSRPTIIQHSGLVFVTFTLPAMLAKLHGLKSWLPCVATFNFEVCVRFFCVLCHLFGSFVTVMTIHFRAEMVP